jgi:hypothetical protein
MPLGEFQEDLHLGEGLPLSLKARRRYRIESGPSYEPSPLKLWRIGLPRRVGGAPQRVLLGRI